MVKVMVRNVQLRVLEVVVKVVEVGVVRWWSRWWRG